MNLNNVDKVYHDLLNDILTNGKIKDDRTGTGTISVFGRMIRFNLSDGFPLLTTKKMWIPGIIHELLWFLKGDTNIEYLNDNGVRIWNEWADEDGVYYIKIEATVKKGDIRDDLQGLKILIDYIVGNPTVMILFQEENLGAVPMFSVAQAKMSEIFSSAGYHLVDETQMQIIQADELTHQLMAGSDNAAVTMADRFGADIVIVGQITTDEFTMSYTKASGLATVQALASIKAIAARTGQVIVAKQADEKAVHFSAKNAGNQAIAKCAGKLADELIYEIPGRLFQSRTVKIVVRGCSFSQRKALMAAFQNIASISHVYPRTFESNVATFDVKIRDSSESLAEYLDALREPGLNIITMNVSQVVAEIASERKEK